MEERQELRKLSEEEQKMENLRIRKTSWIQEQIQRQRDAEDALFEQMKQEQQILDGLRDSIGQNMECTREARKYNQEFQESIDSQVYAMYGITEDKLQGMREYRNAYYQGCAFSLFFLSMVLVVFTGVLHGFQSQLCLFMAMFTGIQGALLNQEGKRSKGMIFCRRMLYLLMFPMMMVIFISYELKYPEYELLLPIFTIFAIVVLALGTAAYFLHNPYRGERRAVEEARDTIRNMEKTARKEVKKNRKVRERSEKRDSRNYQKLQKRAKQNQSKLEKRAKRNQQRQQAWDSGKQRVLSILTKERKVQELLPETTEVLEENDCPVEETSREGNQQQEAEKNENQQVKEDRKQEAEEEIGIPESPEESEMDGQTEEKVNEDII